MMHSSCYEIPECKDGKPATTGTDKKNTAEAGGAAVRITRNPTRSVKIGDFYIGAAHSVAIQSMCATPTRDFLKTAEMAQRLHKAGASLVRIAVDTPEDAASLEKIRKNTSANLSVDLQENYRLAALVSPFVDKIRYNPGHLHHSEPSVSWQEKVRRLADIAAENDCALRIGVNCGSIDPQLAAEASPIIKSAIEHSDFLESLGFLRFCVSLKESDPKRVLAANRQFASMRPQIPLHLGVTEAGMPPEGVLKSRAALEPLLAEGIGDTLRVSLTVSNDRKHLEIEAGRLILENVANGTICREDAYETKGLNIVSCPSCSRVENDKFVELAERIKEATRFAAEKPLKIAVMGCRVNGPGETDDADIGLWCGPQSVHLKQSGKEIGVFGYDCIVQKTVELLRT